MANNIEGSAASGVNKSISNGNGNQLADMTKNLFFGRIFGKRGTNEGGGNTGGGRGYKAGDVNSMNTTIGKQTRKTIKTQSKQTRKTEAARAVLVDNSVTNAAKNGSLAKVNIDKTAGQYNYEFSPNPGYGNGGQNSSQQQKQVKTKQLSKAAIQRQTAQSAAASSYINPSVKGSPMTPAQRSQNRAARSYITPPNA